MHGTVCSLAEPADIRFSLYEGGCQMCAVPDGCRTVPTYTLAGGTPLGRLGRLGWFARSTISGLWYDILPKMSEAELEALERLYTAGCARPLSVLLLPWAFNRPCRLLCTLPAEVPAAAAARELPDLRVPGALMSEADCCGSCHPARTVLLCPSVALRPWTLLLWLPPPTLADRRWEALI